MADDPKPTEETHDLFLPDVPIVMPKGELPVVRDGTVGGASAYEADRPTIDTPSIFPSHVADLYNELVGNDRRYRIESK